MCWTVEYKMINGFLWGGVYTCGHTELAPVRVSFVDSVEVYVQRKMTASQLEDDARLFSGQRVETFEERTVRERVSEL